MERSLIWAEADVLLLAVGDQSSGPVYARGFMQRTEQKTWSARAHQRQRQSQADAAEPPEGVQAQAEGGEGALEEEAGAEVEVAADQAMQELLEEQPEVEVGEDEHEDIFGFDAGSQRSVVEASRGEAERSGAGAVAVLRPVGCTG